MRLAILLTDAAMAKSFVMSGALDRVLDRHQVLCLHGPTTRWLTEDVRFESHREIVRDEASDSRHQFLFDLHTWRFRRRSGAFRLRFYRTFLGNSRLRGMRALLLATRAWIFGVSRPRRFHPVPIVILGSKILFRPARWYISRGLAKPRDIIHALSTFEARMVLIPSSAYEGIGLDAVEAARRTGATSLMLIENWDNLSSKTVLWRRPDHVAVWGEQSANHASSIQGIPESRIHVLGSPRSPRKQGARKKADVAPQIAFLGCALPHLEVSIVGSLQRQLQGHPRLRHARLVYRPHPARQRRSTPDDPMSLSGMAGVEVRSAGSLEELLRESSIVVGPLTTALLEGVVLGLPAVALVNDDRIHRTTASAAMRLYPHLHELPRLRGLSTCDDPLKLLQMVELGLSGDSMRQPEAIDSSYFLSTTELPYSERLARLVDRLDADC